MHTFSETGSGVPAFLAKLWRLVEDTETNNLICWNKDGRSFIIQNQAQFARELLPLNYKHNNMASFIRQLNMYGFHKITSIDNGGLKFDRDDMEFSHPCFKRNCPHLLEHIKRKIANTKTIDEKATVKPEAVSKVLSDVKAMRGRQDSLDSRFSVMKQENEALWREIASLRQKHVKQQQIVNKLIQFLITIVQPARNMTSVKRNIQLMINDTPEQAKLRKASETESESGPVIHELGEDFFDDVNEHDADLGGGPSSPYVNFPSVESCRPDNASPQPRTEHPKSNVSISSPAFDCSNQSFDDALNSTGNATPKSSAVINTVNPDGSQIIYHVTEVPDSIPATPESFMDETHLLTPMVRQMTRNQGSSMKNKRKNSSSTVTKSSATSSPAAKMLRTGDSTNQLRIKTEESDSNPMMFLNANYTSTGACTEEVVAGPSSADSSASSSATASNNINMTRAINPKLISPQSEDSQQQSIVTSHDTDLYNTNDFIASDMPTELFEESPIIDNANLMSGNNKYDFRSFRSFPGKQEMQLQCDNGNGGSSSKPLPSKNSNLQLTKVNNSNKGVGEDTRDEVSSHLDGVQDGLDTLKDLLLSDGYSLDANTLLGLFNDSDILGPYGLSLTSDNSQEAKGSELMTCHQPIYDLSDIMDINDKNNDTNDDSSKQLSESTSVLNTPYHE